MPPEALTPWGAGLVARALELFPGSFALLEPLAAGELVMDVTVV